MRICVFRFNADGRVRVHEFAATAVHRPIDATGRSRLRTGFVRDQTATHDSRRAAIVRWLDKLMENDEMNVKRWNFHPA